MADTDEQQIVRSKKAIAVTQGIGIILIVLSMLTTSAATLLIIISQESSQKMITDQILDCLIPEGACYRDKIQDTNQSSSVEVNLIVNYCSIKHLRSLAEARECVEQEIRK